MPERAHPTTKGKTVRCGFGLLGNRLVKAYLSKQLGISWSRSTEAGGSYAPALRDCVNISSAPARRSGAFGDGPGASALLPSVELGKLTNDWTRLEARGAMSGTPLKPSPEQRLCDQPLDRRRCGVSVADREQQSCVIAHEIAERSNIACDHWQPFIMASATTRPKDSRRDGQITMSHAP